MLAEIKIFFERIKSGCDDKTGFEFAAKLMDDRSVEGLEFHYSLIRSAEMDQEIYNLICRKFPGRGPDGENFLLEKIKTETDELVKARILQVLGTFKYSRGQRLEETLEFATAFLNSENEPLRKRAAMVIGWLGGRDQIEPLADTLERDKSPEVRSMAASAMFQICLSHPAAKESALKQLSSALEKEDDLVALQGILIAVQEICKKKWGLNAFSHNQLSSEKIEEAKKKALRFLKKAYSKN